MKAKLLFSLIMLCCATALFAQQQRTFESMGYDDQSIIGITGSMSYFIKENLMMILITVN